jgi:hypothetical protein
MVAYFVCMVKYYDWPEVEERGHVVRGHVSERVYSNDWKEFAFEPLAWLESCLRGVDVRAVTLDDENPVDET